MVLLMTTEHEMMEVTSGDILKADAEALVNTVNCVGVMGRGIAMQFKKAFPENFRAYKAFCDRKALHPGAMFVFGLGRLENPRYVINFPTKLHWRSKSKIEDIHKGLGALVHEVRQRGITSVAIPPLGCGLGGLDWSTVRKLVEKAFSDLSDVQVLLYEPKGAPAPTEMINRTKRPNMTAGRATLLGLMQRYLAGLMDVCLSLLEIHKLMYFMQEAGEPLKLQYVKARYGPYAKNLGNVLSHIEGHFITGYGDGGDDPSKQVVYRQEAVNAAEMFLREHPKTRERFDRVVELISGFETPYGMELLSTVHWVAKHERATTPEEATRAVYRWGLHKQNIKSKHIRIAWDALEKCGWLK